VTDYVSVFLALLMLAAASAMLGYVAGSIGSRKRVAQLEAQAEYWLDRAVTAEGVGSRLRYALERGPQFAAMHFSHDGSPLSPATLRQLMPRVLPDESR
jgi:hypothetical protein